MAQTPKKGARGHFLHPKADSRLKPAWPLLQVSFSLE
jgi:hypothetical protein